MAGKKEKGSGIQQAAGLIRYFDEESEDAWKISKTQVYVACLVLGGGVYLLNHGVLQFIWSAISSLF
ncbi:MAG: preprotein translocase subunit Sec61beta [Euryarchaeota archaeon]|jgi:preprotein translocase subunit Sec61beta|nr:preprotein translocase subunit Sec61beta [Euryarchaeota archaeon]MAS62403.1 preprotein translocase subunit Sec61beta [Euryarchaeota archaeon]MBJ23301.1 preprotein translocase subunit Sec61beta [Euryarchaeota archaeon]MBK00330.1 preprotein translocase subunit Sec61beta [Euryarchaeota archaeon]|tara:strand:+ start:257 stop:457 length:201 start_codon:yes stop_codon:yes gene_type:complete